MRSLALRKTALVLSSSLFAVLVAAEAGAAPPATGAPAAGPHRSSAQFTMRREEPGGPDGVAARSRARAGDCAGALGLFDLALRHTSEPTLRRDRGLCHEKQGHPFPAIDDYRFYLHMKPEASDAEQIRERLARLEEQVGQGGRSSQAARESKEKDDGASASASGSMETSGSGGSADASASLSVGGSASASGKGKRRDEPTVSEKNYDEYQAQEKLAESADSSPLRYGEGMILGAYVHIPRYFFGEGTSSDMGYAVGGRIGYAMSSSMTVLGEVGYAGIGEGGTNTGAAGPQVLAALEGRFPISRYGSDQILLGGGLGFERYVISGTRVGVDIAMARFKLAYRHVFGPSLALDLGVDGGPGQVFPDGGGESRTVAAVGGAAALVVGF